MKAFDWIALAGALAWLPYLINIIRTFFSKPEVRIITARNIELGFTTYGPILNLRVAFAVANKDVVISNIKLFLKHESGEEKLFTWHGIVQKLLQMNHPDNGLPIPFEKESSVLAVKLRTTDIEERFIRFQDPAYHKNKEGFELKAVKKMNYLKQSNNFDSFQFVKTEEMKDLYVFIKQSFNWKMGMYSIRFDVDSTEKIILEDNLYSFELTQLDIENIEKNKDLIERSYEPTTEANNNEQINWVWLNPLLTKD
ncbi:MAG TPA: hypothetical protein DCS13_01370 [Candidatus Margulisbacteria bacterium]|nr:hypothetical protein [Candidatus Margulisiibacteriota bacterium]